MSFLISIPLLSIALNRSNMKKVPSGDLFLEKVRAAIGQSHMRVALLLSWKQFALGVNDAFAESIDEALSRNVKFRLIVEASEDAVDSKNMAQLCRETSNCQFRFIPHSPRYMFGVYDEQKAFIIVNPEANLADSSALWTNNQSLVSLIHDYFEVLWFISSKKRSFKPSGDKSNVEDVRKKEFPVLF